MNNLFTEDDFYITNAVKEFIINEYETYQFHISLFNTENNPALYWVDETIKNYEKLSYIIAIQERRYEFILHAYYHMLNLATQYESVDVNWSSAMELAQEDIKELFQKYNKKNIILN